MKPKMSPKSFTLPHENPYKLGQGLIISQVMENFRHIEKAFQKMGVMQCRNCNEIMPGSSLGIGGICTTCWIEDENIYDADFLAITDYEILRHIRMLPMFQDMERKDAAIKRENPNHKFSHNHDFMLRESYLGIFSKFDKEGKFRWSREKGVYKKK